MAFKNASAIVYYTESNINLKNTGATLLFSNKDKTKLFFPTKIRIFSSNAAGIVTPPTLSIGTNASSYNNILALTAVSGLTAGTYRDYEPSFPISPLQQDEQIFVNVTIGAVGTTFGARFAIFGNSI